MAKRETEGPVTLSILDRLVDLDPKRHMEPPLTRAQSLRELKASLKRDLEWLLNTRRTLDEVPESSEELQHSLLSYGLPDICSLGIHSPKDQNRLLRTMESTISTFEPRIAGVKVTLEPVAHNTRILRFLIEGLLRIDPAPEHVSFDTVLELTSGQYEVKGEPSAR